MKKTFKEHHETNERGHWIPIDIWNMMTGGELCFNDLQLLLLIDSLVKTKGIGCWASNGYLADKLGFNKFHVSRQVTKLKAKGLVKEVGCVVVGNLKQRIVETSWSRAVDENLALEELDQREAKIEQEIQRQLKVTRKVEVRLNGSSASIAHERKARIARKRKGRIARKSKATIAPKRKQSTYSSYQKSMNRMSQKEGEGDAPTPTPLETHSTGNHSNGRQKSRAPRTAPVPSSNGHQSSRAHATGAVPVTEQIPAECREDTALFRKTVTENHAKLKATSREDMAALVKLQGEIGDYRDTLHWVCANFSQCYRLKVPLFYDLAWFAKNYNFVRDRVGKARVQLAEEKSKQDEDYYY